jgi:hypothetical protein
MVKLDREPTQAAFDFGCLPKTIGSGEINRAQHSDSSERLSIVQRFVHGLTLTQGLC